MSGEIFNLTGDDTLLINDVPLQLDFANGDVATLEMPNEMFTLTTGKNGNTIFAKNESGVNSNLQIMLMRGGKGDLMLNGILSNQQRDFVGMILINAAFVKRLGDGLGNVKYDTYNLQGGMIKKLPAAKSNTEGDGSQGTAQYELGFAKTIRAVS